MTKDTEERYARQIMLPEIGLAGQELLSGSKVLIVGAGGLGSAAALYLAAAGVGSLTIADFDVVNLSNLQRQILYSHENLGKPKAECAAKRLLSLNDSIDVTFVGEGLRLTNAPDLFKDADIVLDCSDNFSTRMIIDETARKQGTPWIFGAVEGFGGMVAFFDPGEEKNFSDLFPDVDTLGSSAGPVGIIGAVAGIIGCVQALECIRYLTLSPQLHSGRLLTFDLKNMTIQKFDF